MTDIPLWLSHYDVPEGHAYADMWQTGYPEIAPGDVDRYGNEYVWTCTSKDAA